MKRSRRSKGLEISRRERANLRVGGQQHLVNRDELLRLAVQVGHIGIFETDLVRKRTRFSPELCDILGLPAGTEMTYEEASRLIDERDREVVRANLEAARKSHDRGRWSGVIRVLRTDGAIRWISIHGRRIYHGRAEGQRPVRSLGTVIDITNLKENEAALRESELRLRLALDAAQMGTFEADITGREARIDEREARLLGLPEDTRVVSADEIRERIPIEDLSASDAKQERMARHLESYHHEFRIRMPDGSERWLSAHADVRSNRIFGVSFDITQRKLAEAALRESEARLRIAADAAALGVFEWDPRTDTMIWENDRMFEIFGLTPADRPLSRRRFVDDYLYLEDARAFDAELKEAIRTRGNFHAVCRIKRKGGARRWLQIDGKFEASVADHPARLIGVVADITQRKRLEARSHRFSERLTNIQDEERRNIAQELHDSTVQHLVAANLTLMNLRLQYPLQSDKQKPWIDLETSLREAMKELRTFSYVMHPPALRARGLQLSLREYIKDFADRSGLDINLRLNRRVDKLSFRLQRSIFRIAQEALANVYRHASASRATVDLRWIGPRLHLIVSDDGRSANSSSESGQRPSLRPGAGIRGIRMRLTQLGGRFKIGRITPYGTRIHASIPVGDTRRKVSARLRGRK
jgi:PAS domain S-box-containing protein